jgi:hypothetical protein
LTGQPDQLTLVFDAGSSSRQNLEGRRHYVTAVRPSSHRALLAEAAGELSEVQLANGARARAWRTNRVIAGKRWEVVVVFSSKLHAGQLQGLHQTLSCMRQGGKAVRLKLFEHWRPICLRVFLARRMWRCALFA